MKDEEKKQQPINVVHLFEQAEAASVNAARYVGGLYQELINNGVPEPVAGEIIKAVALKLLGALPQ